ncbi:hypothetical protein U9M48_029663 [Paspalum notatum var. saurae]|uniref:Uncharacterized protein n=1 Tax=Paspalum notatum var. saurae TaxID=547442 RepID=A0AAQ3U3T0_PASNO
MSEFVPGFFPRDLRNIQRGACSRSSRVVGIALTLGEDAERRKLCQGRATGDRRATGPSAPRIPCVDPGEEQKLGHQEQNKPRANYKMPQVRTASRSVLAGHSGGGFLIRRVASPGALVVKGSVTVKPLARRAQRSSSNKENEPPAGAVMAAPKRRSPLPDWYPRTPLRDITSIIKNALVIAALEKRRSRLEEDASRQPIQRNEDSSQPVDTTPVHSEEDESRQPIQRNEDSSQPVDTTTPIHSEQSDHQRTSEIQEEKGVVASGHGSTSAVANVATSVAKDKPKASSSVSDCSLQTEPSKPIDPSLADVEKKLTHSIEQIEKMVSRHLKEAPKAAQPSKVAVQRRTLMSMR